MELVEFVYIALDAAATILVLQFKVLFKEGEVGVGCKI